MVVGGGSGTRTEELGARMKESEKGNERGRIRGNGGCWEMSESRGRRGTRSSKDREKMEVREGSMARK